MERVFGVPGQGPALRAERHRAGCAGLPDLVPALSPEGVDVPLDVDDLQRPVAGRAVRHQAPTSARIAPGPSSGLPSSSLVAPTRIEILPRCLFSWRSWWASATPSNPITRQSTGRIFPPAISSFARQHSYALAKWEPMICFWRIHR